MFSYENARKKRPLEILFICMLGTKEVYCVFKTWCIICVLFSTNCHLFHNCICPSDTFFINHAVKFKYHSSQIKVNVQLHIYPFYIQHSILFYLNGVADQFFSTFWTVHTIGAALPFPADHLIYCMYMFMLFVCNKNSCLVVCFISLFYELLWMLVTCFSHQFQYNTGWKYAKVVWNYI